MNKLQSLVCQIEKGNEIFKKMTKAEKRVVIAQDCIIRIESKQFKTGKGQLIGNFEKLIGEENNDSLKDLLNTNYNLTCQPCAKGGLFLSMIGRVNKFKISDIESDNERSSAEHKELLKIFTLNQLALIEAAFEGNQYLEFNEKGKFIEFSKIEKQGLLKFWKNNNIIMRDYIDVNSDFSSFTIDWEFRLGEKYNADKVLINICKNIIENKGTFKP